MSAPSHPYGRPRPRRRPTLATCWVTQSRLTTPPANPAFADDGHFRRELSRMGREAVRQPPEPRLDKELARMGLIDAVETAQPDPGQARGGPPRSAPASNACELSYGESRSRSWGLAVSTVLLAVMVLTCFHALTFSLAGRSRWPPPSRRHRTSACRGRSACAEPSSRSLCAARLFSMLVPPLLIRIGWALRAGCTLQEAIDLLTPLIVIPLAWYVFDLSGGLGPAGLVAFLVIAAAWIEGQALHLGRECDR